jgi:hypothetical protein
MVKYVPRSFRVEQVDGNAFFTPAKRDEFRCRILRMTPEYTAQNPGRCVERTIGIRLAATPHVRQDDATEWGKLLQIHIDYHLRQFAA